ncbi:MAG: hypothetical protein PHH62_00500 [Endomicrobiaceae bacterium]|nr:hypothetical protein [Endomicrobiaceae bacterium]
MKKILSIVVACFIFYSFIFVDIIHAIMFLQPTTVSIQSSVGTVSDSFINANDKELVVFIQDLHSNPSVQKNISKIIDTFNKNYGVSKILIEGAPYGKINTKVIDLLREYDIYKISNSLLNKGLFTGTEYYISNDNKDVPVYGLEFIKYKKSS